MNTNLKQLRETLGEDGAEVEFLSISFDPLTDTPVRLREYTESQGFGDPAWRFLTGTPAEIAAVLGAYGIAASEVPPTEHVHDDGSIHPHEREFSHPAQALLIDADGQVRSAYLGAATGSEVFSPELLAADIMTLLEEHAGA
jgi:protein SCO1/2